MNVCTDADDRRRPRRFRRCSAALGLALALATVAASPAAAQLELVGIGGQAFPSPRYITAPPGDEGRVFVVQANGIVRTVDAASNATAPAPFLDVGAEVCDAAEGCGGEAGMFSIAFAPNYAASGLFYAYFTRDVSPGTHEIVIREYRATGPGDADESSGRDVLVIDHPANQNHNGGQLQFGPDGYLYAATGDGGGANDPRNNAQNLNSLLGKLLRIDPADPPGADSYSIPPDNPFAGPIAGADEVYSYGLRNPYRFSFERLTGFLAIGDVGQAAQEEIDFVSVGDARGANFGWDCFEGTAIGLSALLLQPQCTPMSGAHTPPVLTYQRPLTGAAVNGGYVVLDPAVPSLLGRYVYADSVGALGNAIRSAVLFPGGHAQNRATGLTAPNVVSFGEDACDRIYVAADPSGTANDLVSRIEEPAAPPVSCPRAAPQPPPQPPTQAPTPSSPVDANPPKLTVVARRGGKPGEVILRVSCDQACTVAGEGEIKKRGKDISLDPDSIQLAAGEAARLRLELSRRERRRLRRALRTGQKAKAVIEVVATDAAGNADRVRRTLKQKR